MKLLPGIEVESLAPDDAVTLQYARYRVQQKHEVPDEIYSRRDFIMGISLLLPDHYKEVKDFFDKITADDGQSALLKPSPSTATNK